MMKTLLKAVCLIFALLMLLVSCANNNVITPSATPAETPTPSATPTPTPTPVDQATLLESGDLMKFFTPEVRTAQDNSAAFITAQMTFDLALFKKIAGENPGQNLVTSPLSVMLALAMTANGAAGQTKTEMEKLLGGTLTLEQLNVEVYNALVKLNKQGSALTFANAIFYNNDPSLNVLPSFLQTNADYYNAAAYKIPFDDTAVPAVNDWVKNKTDGQIEKIIDKLSENAQMLLINALCFDAEWTNGYAEDTQRAGTFHAVGGKDEDALMMWSTEELYIADGKATGFIKPYKNGYSFAALLPNDGVTLEQYIASLDSATLTKTLQSAKKAAVSAALPKFSHTFGTLLNDALKALGMPTAFSLAADFSGMDGTTDLMIERVIHKCTIAVDENGTKAGAATIVEVVDKSMPTDWYEVVLDRPFLYLILDDATGLPVFICAVQSTAQ